MPVVPKREYQLHKLLVLLLYGNYPWLTRDGRKVKVHTSKLWDLVRVKREKLMEYFERLEQMGFIENLVHECCGEKFELVLPKWVRREDV